MDSRLEGADFAEIATRRGGGWKIMAPEWAVRRFDGRGGIGQRAVFGSLGAGGQRGPNGARAKESRAKVIRAGSLARWGPSRTPPAASQSSLRFGRRRLYAHRAPLPAPTAKGLVCADRVHA